MGWPGIPTRRGDAAKAPQRLSQRPARDLPVVEPWGGASLVLPWRPGPPRGRVTLAGADIALLVAAGLGAGTVNGVAGGGTLVSFPALLATGVPALQANVTSTLGIWPGYLGGVAGFRAEIKGQGRSMRLVGPAVGGAVVGSVLLLITPSSAFKSLAPYLVLLACLLFAVQPLIARWLRSSVATGADVATSADVATGDGAPHPSEAAAAEGRRRHFGVASVGP